MLQINRYTLCLPSREKKKDVKRDTHVCFRAFPYIYMLFYGLLQVIFLIGKLWMDLKPIKTLSLNRSFSEALLIIAKHVESNSSANIKGFSQIFLHMFLFQFVIGFYTPRNLVKVFGMVRSACVFSEFLCNCSTR